MVFLTLFFYYYSLWQIIVPFKAENEFKLELEYKFKQRLSSNTTRIDFEQTDDEKQKKKYGVGSLPYLVIIFRILKLNNGEARLKIVSGDGHTMLSKKAAVDVLYKIDLGYTDDMKDRVTPHEFHIYMLSKDRVEISAVKLFILEDGTFLINDKVRGKF